jgi:hypothetical protein
MKRHRALFALEIVAVVSVALGAQAPAAAPAKPVDKAKPAPAAPPVPEAGLPVNIRLDVAIVDQVGNNPLPPKTLTLMLADRSNSNTRASFSDRTVNMDARPTIVNDRIRMTVTISVDPPKNQGDPFQAGRQMQMLTSILESGKALVVMESVDPSDNNRKMMIELKATIQK